MKKFLFILGLFALVAFSAAFQNQNFGGTGLPTGLLFSAPTFTVSGVGSGNGVLALAGTTSGTAKFTAPSVAGTATNPVLVTNSLQLASGTVYNWNADTGLSRDAAGVIDAGSGAAGDTTGVLQGAGYISKGTKFTTNNGCGETTNLVGGATAGKLTTAGSTSCTTIITFGNGATAPNGWDCHAVDLTTAGDANNPHISASNGTTATIVTGTIVASDVIQFSCIGY